MSYEDIPPSGGSRFWGDPVATFAALPTGSGVGECRLVIDTDIIYEWDGTAWVAVTSGGVDGFADGSVIFAEGGVLASDPEELFWDNATNQLRVGTDTPVDDEKLLVTTAFPVVDAPTGAAGIVTVATDVCSNPSFSTEATCLAAGTCSIPAYDNDEAACEAAFACSNPAYTDESSCVNAGTCSIGGYTDQASCEAAGVCSLPEYTDQAT